MRTFMLLAVVFGALVCSLTACSRTDRKHAGPPEKVTIACAATVDTALAQVAQKRGFLQQEGLDPVMEKYGYGKIALEAVLAGKADFATVAEAPVMFAVMNGKKIAIVATIQKSNASNAIIARKDRGIIGPDGLKGKRIGVTRGTIIEFYLDSFLAVAGLQRRDVTMVDMKPEQMAAAIERGDVDAVSAWSDTAIKVQRLLGNRGITFRDPDIYTQTFLVVATRDFINTHPAAVKKLLRALVSAEQFVKNNPVEAQGDTAEFCGLDRNIVAELWGMESFSVTLDQPLVLALEDESRWAIAGGMLHRQNIPNYLDFIYLDGLAAVKPDAVRILK